MMNTLASHQTQGLGKWSVRGFAITAALGLTICSSVSLAQSGAGSIQGTVTDSAGAVIPGASVHVVEQSSKTAFDTKSNAVGLYTVPSLFTGTYTITYSAPGFKTYQVALELQVAQNAVINPALPPGTVTQQIDVKSDIIQLTTNDSGTISSVLENERINQLPMNGRNVLTLAGMVTPGLEDTGQRANGLMPEALEYVQDGATLANRNFGGENATQAQLPDPDAVQEVRISTTDTSAQYAEPGTAIITTKSGTNSLHGSAFETARNNGFGIAKSRSNPSNFIAPELIRNEFGASIGGPIDLPHIYNGKDKSFFFFAYERYSQAQKSDNNTTVPTVAMRNGDFSGLTNSSGVLAQLYDPMTTQASANCNGTGVANAYCRAPFPTANGLPNQIPISRISPLAKYFYSAYPLPTSAADPLVASNMILPDPTFTVIPNVSFRLDHYFNEKNRAFLRYTNVIETRDELNVNTQPAMLAADGLPAGATGLGYFPTATFTGALGFTHVFSPTFFSETTLSQQWMNQFNGFGGDPYFTDYEAKLGLPNNFGEGGFPGISGSSIMPISGTMTYYGESQILSTIDENLSKTAGRHELTFGGRYRHERFGYLPDRGADIVAFGDYATALENPASGKNYTQTANTGLVDADLFLGAASAYTVNIQSPYEHARDMEFDAYFQDNFHVSKKLTLNIGLRYEAHPAVYIKDGLLESFDLKNKAIVFTNATNTPGDPLSYYVNKGYTTQSVVTSLLNDGVKFESSQQAGYPSTNLRNNDATFGPRVGFAYSPFGDGGAVIRGAYGRYIYPMPVRSYIKSPLSSPPFRIAYTESYTAANQSPDGLSNYLLRAPQSAIAGENSSGVINTAVASVQPNQRVIFIDPDFTPDFVTETNLTVEQPVIRKSSVLRLSWVYTHGTNLDQVLLYNTNPSLYVYETENGVVPPTGEYSTPPPPYDSTFYANSNQENQKTGWSNYNGLQASFQRLYHRGVAYQISYVWSKAFRVGGNSTSDSEIDPFADYLPGSAPAQPTNVPSWGWTHSLDRFENYKVDTAIPKQHITFNGVVDLPVGRGKRFLGNANRFLNEIVGGFQLAGDGNIVSQDFQLSSSNWGQANPLHVYKHGTPITDCRSGVCEKSYEWFNGYIAPTANANVDCTTKCVYGLPSNWVPYQTPINNVPGTSNYGNNNVPVTLNNGNVVQVAYSPGPQGSNPFSQTILNGPINYTVDLSIFKVFPITERVNLRFNMDAFNVLNVQGYNNPNTTDGTDAYQPNGVASSYNTPRQVQFSLRLTF
jgi:hypothetical protein